ncbi:MAG TPA: hypothetical protein VFF33_14720 [Ignavibacteriaceae bacterium]|nr:hypothetical protein [Ignavibacteriaceae bacterium]
MKNFLFVLVLLFTINCFSQQSGWKTTKTSNINVSTAQIVEAFSNSFGNNLIVQKSDGSLIYYVVNPSTGQAINSLTLESNGVSLANITGNINTSYIVYKKIIK